MEMTGPDPAERLRVADALRLWCDPGLVRAVVAAESKYTEVTIHKLGHPNLGGARPARDRGALVDSSTLQRNHDAYMFAWNALAADFRRRLVGGELYLLGVLVHPERETAHRPVPGVWAAEYEIDYETDELRVAGRRYVAVVCTRTPPADPEAPRTDPGRAPSPITAEGVGDLSDEEVALLLEEHARRVVENADARLLAAATIKASMMPIIRRKMQHRASTGELLETLADEAAELRRWIEAKVPSHQVPTPGAIGNALRREYRDLKAQSKPMKA
jgi:hypothetical protein